MAGGADGDRGRGDAPVSGVVPLERGEPKNWARLSVGEGSAAQGAPGAPAGPQPLPGPEAGLLSPTFAFAFAFSAPPTRGAQLAGGPAAGLSGPAGLGLLPEASPASRAGDSAALAGAWRAVLRSHTLPRGLAPHPVALRLRSRPAAPWPGARPTFGVGLRLRPTARLDASLCGRAGAPAPGPQHLAAPLAAALIRGPAGRFDEAEAEGPPRARGPGSPGVSWVRAPGPFSASLFHSQPRVPEGPGPGDACQAAGKSGGGGQGPGRAVGVRRAKQSVQAGQGLLKPETRAGGCASPGVWEAVSLLPWTSRARRSPRPWDLGAPGVRGGARVASQNGQKALSARFGKFKEVFQDNSEASGCRWWPSGRPERGAGRRGRSALRRTAGQESAERAARPALIDSQSEGVKENKSGGSAVLVTC